MAQAADEPRLGQHLPYPAGRLGALEIDRRGLPHRRRVPRLGEQLLVFGQRLHRKTVHVRVAVQQPPLVVHAVGEVVGLLHLAHEHRRVLGQVPIQRGGARLGGADDDEIRERHSSNSTSGAERSAIPSGTTLAVRGSACVSRARS